MTAVQNLPASSLVSLGVPALAVLVLALWVLGVAEAERRLGASPARVRGRAALAGLAGAAWAGFTLLAARSGLLARFDARPPPLLVLLALTLLGALVLARSRVGERLALGLPLWALVGFQAFRLPLELVLHRAAMDGTMPIEMSFSGYNFDIVSGVSALFVAPALVRSARPRLALLWNVLGVLLLANIVLIAIAATPVFHAFGPDHLNTWVCRAPFVLLPSVLVMAALFGHVVVFRKLRLLAKLSASSTGLAGRHRPDRVAERR
jgi:hypothetical protein